MRYILSFFPSAAWAVIIAILSLLPGNDFPKWHFLELIHADKWVHITMYFIFSVLLVGGIWRVKKTFPSLPIQGGLALLALLYGILMEICQELFTTTRHFEWGDIVADAVGAYIGVILVRYAWKKKMFFIGA